jgi:hypothetical protein
MTMERKLVDVGHRVETEPGVVSDITHAVAGTGEVGRTMGAEFGEAYQALKNGCGRGWQRVQNQTDEVIAHARKEPVIAMTAAASFGFLLGLAAMAISSRGGTGGGRSWLPELHSRRSFLGRRTGSGWWGLLRHS